MDHHDELDGTARHHVAMLLEIDVETLLHLDAARRKRPRLDGHQADPDRLVDLRRGGTRQCDGCYECRNR